MPGVPSAPMDDEPTSTLPPPEIAVENPAAIAWWKRKWHPHLPVWSLIAVGVLMLGAIGAAAGASSNKKEIDKLTSERDAVADELAAAEAANEDLASQLESANGLVSETETARDTALEERDQVQDELDQTKDELDQVKGERDDALTTAEQATADLDAIRVRFDPEIQAAIANITNSADATVCSAGDAAGFAGQPIPSLDDVLDPLLATVPDAALPGNDPRQFLPMAALAQRLEDCYSAGENRGTLEGPHGDGLFTVGLEIAAGKWRSDGEGDSCYWQINPDGSPDDITSNHFGNAGGSVTLRAGQEFQSDGCGTWTKV